MKLKSRTRSIIIFASCAAFFAAIFLCAAVGGERGTSPDLLNRNLSPSFLFPLGTDWLGRDMLFRVIKGLSASFMIGFLSACVSSVFSALLGVSAALFGRKVDSVISGLIDTFMSVPHIVLLILVAFAAGGGQKGIIIAVAVSHWPRLARILRAEVMQIKTSEYVKLSLKFGKRRSWIAIHHIAFQLTGQFLVGTILMFPHAILHAAGLSFIGFGLSPDNPCIGILLSESMRYLTTGYWWLAIFPGAALVLMVKTFDIAGAEFKKTFFPRMKQE